MRKLLYLAALAVSVVAWGDTLLGVIYVSDGGSANNATTGYGSAGCALQTSAGGAGACEQSFRIPTNALISVQNQDQCAMVSVNSSFTDAGMGIKMSQADQFLTLSTNVGALTVWAANPDGGLINTHSMPGGLLDGGTYTGGVVSIAPCAGNAAARLKVFGRQGNE